MKDKPNTTARVWGTIIGLAGIGYCIAAALGAIDAVCVTDGCSLHKNVTFLGFNMWWWGVGAFSLVTLCAAAGFTGLAFGLACLGVVIDLFFLGWLALTAPCVSCLGAAVLLLLLLFALKPPNSGRLVLVLFVLWLALFTPSAFGVAQDTMEPWPIHGEADARVKVIFSPTCHTCVEAIQEMLDKRVQRVAYFPVAKSDKELARIRLLLTELESGASFEKAFTAMMTAQDIPASPGVMDDFGLRMKLYRNELALLRAGTNKVPLILVSGNPAWYFPMD